MSRQRARRHTQRIPRQRSTPEAGAAGEPPRRKAPAREQRQREARVPEQQRRGARVPEHQRRDARAREQQRREARRRARSKTRRTGWAGMRRSRGQRIGIAGAAVAGTALIWLLADWPLAIGLTALLVLALPAFVVLTMGRR